MNSIRLIFMLKINNKTTNKQIKTSSYHSLRLLKSGALLRFLKALHLNCYGFIMKLRYFFATCLLMISTQVFATQQISEKLIVDSKEYRIDEKPLEQLYNSNQISDIIGTYSLCSANWRGYVGTWELSGKELFVKSVVINACSDETVIDPFKLFSETDFPIKAKWYTGSINIYTSKRKYITVTDSDGRKNSVGYEVDAIVYMFTNGILTSKNKKRIKVN